MKRLLPWLGLALSVLCAGFFIRAIARHWNALSQLDWSAGVLPGTLVAILLYVATYLSVSRAWQIELRAVGVERSFEEIARIVLKSQFAKYLPGNVGHHIGRVVLAGREGIPMAKVLASMVMDTLLVMVAGATLALPALALLLRVLEERGIDAPSAMMVLTAITGIALLTLLVVPALRQRVLTLWPRGIEPQRVAGQLLQSWLFQATSFVLGATALFALCAGVAGAHALSLTVWIQIMGIYATAWLLGFIVPGAPAGLGVREVVLLLGLSPLIGESHAVSASLLLRLVTTTGDGLVFAAAMLGRSPNPARQSP